MSAVALLPDASTDTRASRRSRRAYRAPAGLPGRREHWRAGVVVSFAFHALIVLLIVAPFAFMKELALIEQGAGGEGPAGGGGGGTRGTGSTRHEALRYVTVAPAATATPAPAVVPPPEQPKVDVPLPQLPELEPPKVSQLLPLTGVGGGTGTDGSTGTGPGSGGGVGTGVGTGTGSATGPGTGGGRQANHPPTPTEMFIPPMPVPRSARGMHIVAQFDVDETGRVRGIEFTRTPDRGYNRRLQEVLEGYRFRPGTGPDGRPVRMTYQMEIDLP